MEIEFTPDEFRLLRAIFHLKQETVALIMGVSKQRVSQIENHPGHIEEKTIEKYLGALGFTSKSARKYLDSLSKSKVKTL
jgi:DNA-binding XRE family transcriptional regulator